MLKFFITGLFSVSYLLASSQKIAPHWTPQNIDSLKKVLSTAHGIHRVNLLNELSYAYYYVQTDSSRSYTQQAYSEASILGYQKGLAISLLYSVSWNICLTIIKSRAICRTGI